MGNIGCRRMAGRAGFRVVVRLAHDPGVGMKLDGPGLGDEDRGTGRVRDSFYRLTYEPDRFCARGDVFVDRGDGSQGGPR